MSAPVTAVDAKYEALLARLAPKGRAVVAFSGGQDSTLLLFAAGQALGDGALAVTIAAPYSPKDELADAREMAQEMAQTLGVRHRVIDVPLPEELRHNPPERCYLCKKALFARLLDIARAEGAPHVLDGTNLDDLGDHRPGFKALAELGVESPLLEAGLGKRDIRELSKRFGLPTWNKPAGACLLTRLPHGAAVHEAELARIDHGEKLLRRLGFPAVRLRSHGDVARIEVPRERLADLLEADRLHGVDAGLKALGYRHVAVDLAGYRMGSLNEKA